MRIRVRGPQGQATINLAEEATVFDLIAEISHATSVEEFDVRYGYPPRPLELPKDPTDAATTPLSSLGVRLNGEQLIISEKAVLETPTAAASLAEKAAPQAYTNNFGSAGNSAGPLSLNRKPPLQDTPEIPVPTHGSTMVLRVMPDDNSCLFRAFSSAALGSELDSMHELRSIIAQVIQADPDTYNEAVLDKKPDAYCRWIQNPDAWGGGIELSILSDHFDVCICSIDVQTLRVDRFGENKLKRVILVYSGIHYDVIALSPSEPPFKHATAPPEIDLKVFEAGDEVIVERAIELCRILQGQNYFTDTAGFGVKCNVCGGVFTGEKGATDHAAATGHYDFAEG